MRYFLAVGIFLASAEVLVRVTGADWKLLRPLLYYQAVDLPVHQASDDVRLLYELKKSASAVIAGRTITTNSLGFRDRERAVKKPAGVYRIVCLGSSNTYGAMVDNGETYPARTEALLNEGRRGKIRYEVWNAGVSAYTLGQSASSAAEIVRKYAPDLLLIQLHSTKRRPFLLDAPFARYFDAVPSLYAENLRFLPFDGALLGRWRFYRALVILYNRMKAGPGNNPRFDGDGPSEDALRLLVEKYGKALPIVILYNPGWHGELLPELGLKSIFLEKHLPTDYSADHLLIHPPAYVYRWYARVLAAALPLPRGL